MVVLVVVVVVVAVIVIVVVVDHRDRGRGRGRGRGRNRAHDRCTGTLTNHSAQLSRRAVDNLGMLNFQTLDSYKLAIEFIALALEIIRALPRGHAQDADQLRRSAKSIARNIAEGAGRSSNADKAHHYTVARGEAMESACTLDVMSAEGVVTVERHDRGVVLLERIVSILTKSIQNLREPAGNDQIVAADRR